MSRGIEHNRPTIGFREYIACANPILKGRPADRVQVKKYEESIANFLGVDPYSVVAFSSGSAALFVAFKCGQELGMRVVQIPAYGCASLTQAALLAGLKIVYIDNKSDDNPNAEYILEQQKHIFPLVTNTFGIPSSIQKIQQSKFWIEDISQSLGATRNWIKVGTEASISICSTSYSKLITTAGYGGFLIARDGDLIDFCRDFRDFDGRDDSKFRFNFCLSDVAAACGRVQIERLPRFLELRESLYECYMENDIKLVNSASQNDVPVRYRAVIKNRAPNKLIKYLSSHGVVAIVPYNKRELPITDLKNASEFASTSVSIPIYPTLKRSQVNAISKLIRNFE